MRQWSKPCLAAERIGRSSTRAESRPLISRQATPYVQGSRRGEAGPLSQPRQIFCAGCDIVLGDRQHQIGHARIIAAAAFAEIDHGLVEVFPGLTREPRLRSLALVFALMAAGAGKRSVGLHRPCGDICRRLGLLQVRPTLLKEIERERQHLIAVHRLDKRRHDVVLAHTALEIPQLQIGVALVLTPYDRHGLLLGMPSSPWQAAQSCALSSRVCARASAGSTIVARTSLVMFRPRANNGFQWL